MNNKILDNKITTLDLDNNVINILNSKDIYFVKELWPMSRNDLRELSLNDHQIKQIIICLQLNGIDLNKRIYN